MRRGELLRAAFIAATAALVIAPTGAARDLDSVPPALAPLEYLIGGWKGVGAPEANRVKGWSETHRWAWKFSKGTPSGLNGTFENDKLIKQAELSYDNASQSFVLKGTGPDGKAVSYQGKLDATGKVLTLARTADIEGARERLILRPNSEKIRYTIVVERQAEGSPRFARFMEIGVTKEGEAFAAGSGVTDLPKCIITGGAANMTVTFEGKSYPICCSGCRDEFNDNPAKYVKKALLRAQAGGGSAAPAAKPAARPSGKEDTSFDGLVDEPKPKANTKEMARPKARSGAADAPAESKPSAKSAAKPAPDPATRAASLLSQARAFEKSGKTDTALSYYKRITKEFADTPSAKTAGERIKALEK
jgi:YHS domain-containing protein